MTILFIIDEFDEKTIFEHLNFENIISIIVLYQFMLNTKKKVFVKQTKLILISESAIYIKKNETIFWIWLNRFRKKSILTTKKRQFVFKRTDIVKKKKKRTSTISKKKQNFSLKIQIDHEMPIETIQKLFAQKIKMSYECMKKKTVRIDDRN